MVGLTVALIVGIGLPLGAFIYAVIKKRALPFLLGVLAFVISQMALRLPLLKFLTKQSTSFNMLSMTQPIVYFLIIGFSAGIFEEVARYIGIRFFMRQRDFQAGALFGAGHGGVEVIILFGINVVIMLTSSMALVQVDTLLIGSVERVFAMLLHIGLSIIVLYGVVTKKIRYLIMAIILHGVIDSLIGLVPMFVRSEWTIFVIEGALIIMSVSVIIFSIRLKRKGAI